ncbi:hypothetical protein [Algoriphagus aquimarinus]|uniref:Uncharacterized protein n=1 Tax=Algoriphagus aquimarinus TaxID=237018 RepID=A0A1I1BK08_9BACT|nr:hypothetical protein [Algoriphagus aquimarinus]SFB50591.1 hypothetical protein SAMN04489723_11484 [Algoriphagus aquimarinus]
MKNSVSELVKELENNPALQDDFKKDPLGAVKKFENSGPVYLNDIWVYRIVIGVLGLVILSVIIGVIAIMASNIGEVDSKVPTLLTATCSAAIGALTGLLAPAPNRTN